MSRRAEGRSRILDLGGAESEGALLRTRHRGCRTATGGLVFEGWQTNWAVRREGCAVVEVGGRVRSQSAGGGRVVKRGLDRQNFWAWLRGCAGHRRKQSFGGFCQSDTDSVCGWAGWANGQRDGDPAAW